MGRTSINWMNPDVQQSIDDYICRRIPTQAKLRQVISDHLQQPISEQALSIYLKRTGVSFPRKTNSPTNSSKLNSDSSQGHSFKQTMAALGGASVAVSGAPHPLVASAEHFYASGGQPLFMNALSGVTGAAGDSASESPSAASSSALIVDASGANSALNFVHTSSSQAAAFNNILDMSRNATANNSANNNNMLNMNNSSNIQRYILDDSQQQLHRAVEIQHNLQLQQQAAANHWHQQQTSQQHANPQQQSASSGAINNSTNNNNGGGSSSNGGGDGIRPAKRPSTASQPINWKDPFVQNAITNYFNRKIKLQTELRLMIMERLKRNVSENSLRLYLKKVKNQFELSSSASSSQQSLVLDGLVTSSSANCLPASSATTATVLAFNDAFRHLSTTAASSSSTRDGDHNSHHNSSSNNGQQQIQLTTDSSVAPSKEIAYYFCNNIASFSGSCPPTMSYAPTANPGTIQGNVATQQMLHSIETYGFGNNNSAGDLVGKSLQLAPPTMVKTLMNEQFFKTHSDASVEHLVKVGVTGDLLQQQELGQQQKDGLSNGVSKREKDDVKPSVRRRINWGNADVQNAIQDFYGRKILTQAKLRSIIEAVLGHGVSEQALSIYLKRKKSRNPTSEEIILMNINCGDDNLA